MKIQNNGLPANQVEQSQSAKQSGRLGAGSQQEGSSTTRQVGLDRVEVSNIAETASRVLAASGEGRAQQVATLAQLYQSGKYSVNANQLSQAIIEHDLQPDHAGSAS
jgi:anti-sigma28 factor (negative regulator of flagellin synthesis)